MTNTRNVSPAERPPSTVEDGYRYDHFTLPLMIHDSRFSRDSLAPGDVLPNQTLIRTDGTRTDLRAVAADRPLVLIVGSVSCPMTISSLPRLVELEQKYGEQLSFALVYAREAHPGENYGQARTPEEKVQGGRAPRGIAGMALQKFAQAALYGKATLQDVEIQPIGYSAVHCRKNR